MIFIVKVIKIIVYLHNTQWCFSLGLIPLATYLILCSVVFSYIKCLIVLGFSLSRKLVFVSAVS